MDLKSKALSIAKLEVSEGSGNRSAIFNKIRNNFFQNILIPLLSPEHDDDLYYTEYIKKIKLAYTEYIKKIKLNDLAWRVKIAKYKKALRSGKP